MGLTGGRMELLYKIAAIALWEEAKAKGVFTGAPIDLADGYIHFSTKDQAEETARKWFSGQNDLLLIAADPASLQDQLRWEPSRGGALFPHLYGPLPLSAVKSVHPLPLKPDGSHDFSGLFE